MLEHNGRWMTQANLNCADNLHSATHQLGSNTDDNQIDSQSTVARQRQIDSHD